MIKKGIIILFIVLFSSIKVSALENVNIELFDINKGCVVNRIESNSTIQKEVESYLKNITGIFSKLNPVPDKGYMLKIPLDTPVMIQNQWLNTFVDEVIIIFPEQEKPYLMVFDNKDRTLFFYFKGDINVLLKNINFDNKTS